MNLALNTFNGQERASECRFPVDSALAPHDKLLSKAYKVREKTVKPGVQQQLINSLWKIIEFG